MFALLGHNGAGKTTAIRCMTGMLAPTDGDVRINGLSVNSEVDQVRQQIGCCPQHNILWNELTAREHLEFFGRFHGMSGVALEEATDSLLSDVNLMKVGAHQASYALI